MNLTDSYKEKVILITGSSRGIGRYLALNFGKLKATVIVNYTKSKKEALTVVGEIEKNGGKAIAIKADVSKMKEVKTMFNKIIKKYGHVDVLINNAGAVFENNDWTKHNEKNWSETMAANLTSVFNCSFTVAPLMLKQKHGKILNISSLRSVFGASDVIAYAAAKAGVNNLTKSYAKTLAPYVNVNSLVLGRINGGMGKFNEKKTFGNNLMKRLGSYNDVFYAACFLTSSKANFITGQMLIVDGGASLKN